MAGTLITVALLLLPLLAGRSRAAHPQEITDRPVIGILSLEVSPKIREHCGDHDSYIAASYVKFVEGAGAQVAPILIGQSDEYYRRMVQGVNGLLFPGGATYLKNDSGYMNAGRVLYELAKEMNENGVHFPVFGICLGMELLAVLSAGEDLRTPCDSHDARALQFVSGSARVSRLFSRAPRSVIRTLESDLVTANQHGWCLTQENMTRHGLDKVWQTLTVSKDANDLEFISTFEHRKLPFYGTQFHPEKNIYEWRRKKNYPHSGKAVAATRYFTDFFVSEARRNSHRFPADEERDQLIYRHQPVDTREKLQWEQLYFFSSPKEGAPEPKEDRKSP